MFTDETRADRPVDEVLSVANFYRKWSPPPHRVPVTHKDLQVNGHSHMVGNVILSVINSQYSVTCSDYCEGKSLIYEKSIMKKNLNFISWQWSGSNIAYCEYNHNSHTWILQINNYLYKIQCTIFVYHYLYLMSIIFSIWFVALFSELSPSAPRRWL